MKKLLLLLIICACPLLAGDVYLGIAGGISGDTLILTDNLKIYVPNIRQAFVNGRGELIPFEKITFPLEASLVTPEGQTGDPASDNSRERGRLGITTTCVRVHKFFDIKDGRLIEKTAYH